MPSSISVQPLVEPARRREQVRVFRHEAMATWFELRLEVEDAAYAAQAALAAFDLLDRLEQWLSRFRANSDVSRVNRAAGCTAVPVNPRTFALLRRCVALTELTEGAFDVTAAFGTHARPGVAALQLDHGSRQVGLVSRAGRLDLGAVGKGFALDEMGAVLREWEVGRALLIGGGSSLLGLAGPGADRGWPIWLEGRAGPIELRREGLGVSGQRRAPHVVDPRSGRWVRRDRTAWCLAPDATSADALSTAGLMFAPGHFARVCRRVGATLAGMSP